MDKFRHWDRYCYLATVLSVTDGDTVVLQIDLGFRASFVTPVRLFGVNAPELFSGGPEERRRGAAAKAFLQTLLADCGNTVHIRTHKDSRDKYGRYLAQLFHPVTGDGLIETMIRAGHAVPHTY